MATKKNKVLVPDHIYVPKHEIISKQEAEEIIKKYNCKPTELPLIFVNDPAILGLGVKPGDMIKITRKVQLLVRVSITDMWWKYRWYILLTNAVT